MSSIVSRPTDSRTSPGSTPVASCSTSVTDVGHVAVQLERLDEGPTGRRATLDDERRHGPGALAAGVLLGPLVPPGGGETGELHRGHLGLTGQVLGHLLGVRVVALHAQTEGLEALEEQERVEGRRRRTDVAEELHPRLEHVRAGAEGGPVGEAVVAGIGIGELGELVAGGEVEGAAIDDHPADRRAVAPDELRGGVHDDVGPPLEGPDEPRRRHRVVDDEGHAVGVGDTRDALDVEDVVAGVADGLAVEGLGVRAHGRGPGVEVVGVVDERGLDAHLGQRVVEEVVRAAVEGGGRDDVAAGLGQVQDGEGLGRLTGRDGERTGDAEGGVGCALEAGDAGLEHGLGRVHDPGVDVADLGQPEEVGGMGRVAELVRGGLVDRYRPGPGGGVRLLSGVDLTGLESPGVVGHSCLLLSGATSAPSGRPSH